MSYTPSSNPLVSETCIQGNWVPSSSSSWRYRVVAAYAVDDNSDNTVTFYYRFFVETYGTIGSTLQSSLCGGGNWGTSMAGTYLQGASGETWYYGTSCAANQFDYKLTLTRGATVSETNYVGHIGGSGTSYQTTVTLSYTAPNPATSLYVYNGSAWKQGTAAYVFNGSAWKKATAIYVFNGSAWKIQK